MRPTLTAVALTLLLATLTLATPALANPDPTNADAEQMARLFDTLCLRAFPDRADMEKAIGQLDAVPLTEDEVRAMLHDDPGEGWRVRRPEATYLVTVEAPPWHACAIRRMTRNGLPTTQAYDAAIKRYAVNRQRPLAAPVSQTVHGDGGVDIRATMRQLPAARAAGGVTDSLMLFTTDYHGRYRGPLDADSGSPGVEVRFVHQLRSMGVAP